VSDKPGSRDRNSLATKLALAISSVLVTLVGLELAWRVHLYQNGKGFFDDPREFSSPFFTIYEEPPPYIFSAGFWYRNGTVSRQKPANEIRIICFGGSTTVNYRAGISYTDILERRFVAEEPGYAIRVLNAGGDGYSTAHMLVNLSLRNLDAQPDIITVYENINDSSAIYFGNEVAPDYANKYLTDAYLGLRHRTGVIAEVTKVSRLARFLVSRSTALMWPAFEQTETTDYARGIVYFQRNLRSIVAIAKANGIRVLLASQAAKADFRGNEVFSAYNEMVREIADREGVAFVDIANAVTDDESFLPDGIHCNRHGVERLAEEFYPPLRRLLDEVTAERERARAATRSAPTPRASAGRSRSGFGLLSPTACALAGSMVR